MKRWLVFLAGRAAFTGFFLFSSLWALLAYVPFTYQQVHKGGLIPALNEFSRIHSWLHLAAVLVGIATLGFDRPPGFSINPLGRRLRRIWVLLLVLQSIVLVFVPVMARLENDIRSYLFGMAALVPVLLLAVIDWCELIPVVEWAREACPEDAAVFRAAWQSSLFLAGFSSAWVYVRARPIDWNVGAGVFAAGWDLMSHLLVLMLFFVVLNLLAVLASWFRRPARIEFALYHLLGATLLWVVFHMIIFPAISFSDWKSDLYAAVFAFVATCFLSGICLRLYLRTGGVVESGLALSFWINGENTPMSRRRLAVMLATITLTAGGLLFQTSKMDWNYLMQKLTILIIWIAVFRLCYKTAFLLPSMKKRSIVLLLTALGVLAGYRTLQATQRVFWKQTRSPLMSAAFLEKYTGYDVSFKLIRDAVSPAQTVDPEFYHYLSKHTNIPRPVETKPVEMRMVEKLEPAVNRPNIFLIVVDSLRQDYVSAYNSNVDFTPALGAFGKESAVFQNAFTHYGGTGLSEPSIWAGGMLLHKQYVTPFRPMNTLQKLLEADQYKAFVSRDTILETVVTPWPKLQPLDDNKATMDYDLCSSLEELEGKITAEGAPHSGLFSYTQPQNIHISRINREGGKAIDDRDYKSFYPPYASRLRRIDGCFGKFIQYLKDKGIYDDSIVIFTADHGDSLGEEGRWGHAYTIYPEIVRIPLMIHLPVSLRGLASVPKVVAFSTDITPTLYYLLGHRPVVKHEFQGRPLFTERPEEQGAYRSDNYLIASSYAAVYGVLNGEGTQLFVSDAVNFKDYVFSLGGFSSSVSMASTSMRSEFQSLIRDKIEAIGKWYGLKEH